MTHSSIASSSCPVSLSFLTFPDVLLYQLNIDSPVSLIYIYPYLLSSPLSLKTPPLSFCCCTYLTTLNRVKMESNISSGGLCSETDP